MRKVLLIGGLGAAVSVLAIVAVCGGGTSSTTASAVDLAPPTCPKEWKTGWQRLANNIKAPVYCPSWLPQELDGRFDGVFNGQTVLKILRREPALKRYPNGLM